MFKDLAKTKPRFYGSLGLSFTKQQIFVKALNMGNEGNIQRLVDNSNGWSFMKGKKLTWKILSIATTLPNYWDTGNLIYWDATG